MCNHVASMRLSKKKKNVASMRPINLKFYIKQKIKIYLKYEPFSFNRTVQK
jgi:hypothetical protein